MTIRTRSARRVCTQAELKLFTDSRLPSLRNLTIPQLQRRQVKSRQACRKAHERALKLKDNASRNAASERAYDDAVRRVEVLEEVSGRFDRRLEKQLNARAGKEHGTRRRRLRVRRQLKVTPSSSEKRVTKTTQAKKSRFEEGANPRIEGHVSSRDRRQQVLSDRRR